jgi:hypothetical protein
MDARPANAVRHAMFPFLDASGTLESQLNANQPPAQPSTNH